MAKGSIRIVRTSTGQEYFKTEEQVAAIQANPLIASKYKIDKSVKAPAEVAEAKGEVKEAAEKPAANSKKSGASSDQKDDENQQ